MDAKASIDEIESMDRSIDEIESMDRSIDRIESMDRSIESNRIDGPIDASSRV